MTHDARFLSGFVLHSSLGHPGPGCEGVRKANTAQDIAAHGQDLIKPVQVSSLHPPCNSHPFKFRLTGCYQFIDQ